MSKTPNDDRTGAQPSADATSLDRRTFVKAAAAGAGALAMGTSLSGSASAAIDTPQLAVEGNTFVDPEGNPVTLRGVNVIDARRANALASFRGKNAVQMVDNVTGDDWGTQVIRLPMQPSDIGGLKTGYCNGPATPPSFTREQLKAYCAEHVDPVVQRCQERGVYCILDYHRHWTKNSVDENNTEFDGYFGDDSGNLHAELQDEVTMFWEVVADRYGDLNHALFEVYNEPTKPGLWEDPRTTPWCAERWFWWVEFIQPALDAIDASTDNPVLLGSPSWTQSPEGILLTKEDVPSYMKEDFKQISEPSGGVAMTYHTYPGHTISEDQEWGGQNGNGEGLAGVHEEYPVFVTEFGWEKGGGDTVGGTTSEFGAPFMEFMESGTARDAISWTAWCGDIWWTPTMFDTAFEGTDASICDPYDAEVPQDCTDLPCEWTLAGTDGEEAYDARMGKLVHESLAENADHNNPQVEGEQDPGQPPSPPTSPDEQWTNSVTPNAIDIGWSAVDEATAYDVFLDGSEVDSTPNTSHTFSDLDPDTEYLVGVRAVNDAGPSETIETTVRTAEVGGSTCSDSATVNGRTVCDTDGDGYYDDFNADGNATHADVQEFFSVQHRPAWKQPDRFDFNGNEMVGHGDVVALFEQVAAQGL